MASVQKTQAELYQEIRELNLEHRKRVSEWFTADPTNDALLRISSIAGGVVTACAVSGFVGGAIGGGLPGAGIGFAAGLCSGMVASCIHVNIELHQNFKNWKKAQIDSGLTEAFKAFYQEQPAFQQFVCEINCELFEDPAKMLCCGKTYEKKIILETLSRDPNKACPNCRKEGLDEKNVETDLVMIGRMKVAYRQVAKDFSSIEGFQAYPSEIKAAVEALDKDLAIQVTEVFKELSTKLTLDHNDNKITTQDFATKIAQLSQMLGVSPQGV